MITPQSDRSSATLLADYEQWQSFVVIALHTIQTYDRQLNRIARRYADLRAMSTYLRDCMRYRAQFFRELSTLLAEKVVQLRQEPTNKELARRLNYAHPAMLTLIRQLIEALAEIQESYSMLTTFINRIDDDTVV